MADKPDPLISVPAGFESIVDPCGDNPFPPADPRFQIWSEATRAAEEDLCGLDSDLLHRMNAFPRDGDSQEKFYALWIETFTRKFDIWAKRAICVVRNDEAIRHYDRWISSYVHAMLVLARDNCPERYPKEYLITELKYQLLPRLKYWKGAARKYAREIHQAWATQKRKEVEEAGADATAVDGLPEEGVNERSEPGESEDLGGSELSAGVPKGKRIPSNTPRSGARRRRKPDAQLENLRSEVRKMYGARLTQRQMCARLSGNARPPGVAWRDLDWPAAYRHPKYGASVRKWLSEAAAT